MPAYGFKGNDHGCSNTGSQATRANKFGAVAFTIFGRSVMELAL